MIRLVVSCETLEQLETLLLATRAVGLTPDLGVGPEPPPSRRRKERSTKNIRSGKNKPKRYPPKMAIKIGKLPKNAAPKLVESYNAISQEFGTKVFEKRLAKGVLAKKFGSNRPGLSTYVTEMLDRGNLLPA